MNIEHLRGWIGRREEVDDVVSAGPLARLAATFDHEFSPERQRELPPLTHWLYCLPGTRQSEVGPDGHAARGAFIPPVALPRRMWAGGQIDFLRPIRIGDVIRRTSTIADVTCKAGRTGELAFVTVAHEISVLGAVALREEQTLVYRDIPARGETTPPARISLPAETARWHRIITPDPILLFRFSALTFNAHRVHYDRDYCRDIEGYPGLVVHAPLTAMLLMDLFLDNNAGARVTHMTYRAHRPLFDTAPFSVRGRSQDGDATLWAVDSTGGTAMTAALKIAT